MASSNLPAPTLPLTPSTSVRIFLALLLCCCATSLDAQELLTPASELSGYLRLLEIEGKATGMPLVFWSSSTAPRPDGLTLDSGHVWSNRYALATAGASRSRRSWRGLEWHLLDVRLDAIDNSAFPRTANDGALWAGRGLTGALTGGIEGRWRFVSARLAPTFGAAQNQRFTLAVGPGTAASPFAYPWQANIDFPQRFGTATRRYADWGQSALRLDGGAFTVAFSTENLWWGPGYRNAIVMGSAAPGFPHVDAGTSRPLHTAIGDVEARAIWGQLARSPYVGASTSNGRRVIDGLTLGYKPRHLDGLTLGLSRVLYHEWPAKGVTASDFLDAFGGVFNPGKPVDSTGILVNDQNDQIASVSARWVLPRSGAEFYVEYARNDFAGGITDLVLQPDHSRGITAGFQKTLDVATGALVLRGEATTLGQTTTRQLREGSPFYVHGIVTEGYTHRGQLLGATIGPGSNAQFIGLDRYTRHGRYGLFGERIRYDDDYSFQALKSVNEGYLSQQVDLSTGVSMLRFARLVDWGASLEMTRQLNRYFIRENNVTNWKLSVNLAWHRRAVSNATGSASPE